MVLTILPPAEPFAPSPSCLSLLPRSLALAIETLSICSGLPRAWGISLPLKLCSCVCNPQQQVQRVERRWQSPRAVSDPSPGPAILILVGTPRHPPIPLLIYVQLLLTNGLPGMETSGSSSEWKSV